MTYVVGRTKAPNPLDESRFTELNAPTALDFKIKSILVRFRGSKPQVDGLAVI